MAAALRFCALCPPKFLRADCGGASSIESTLGQLVASGLLARAARIRHERALASAGLPADPSAACPPAEPRPVGRAGGR